MSFTQLDTAVLLQFILLKPSVFQGTLSKVQPHSLPRVLGLNKRLVASKPALREHRPQFVSPPPPLITTTVK